MDSSIFTYYLKRLRVLSELTREVTRRYNINTNKIMDRFNYKS